MTDPRPKAPRLRLVLAMLGVVVLAAAVALYASRKIIAREALTGWLQSKGVASEAEVEAFGLNGFTGRVTVGDPKNPDFATDRAEVRYGFKGFGIEVVSVKLTKPVVRARVHDGQLSVGSLDPLIAEFRKRPPRPDARKPRIEVDDGLLLLATDYGPVRLTADARVEDGKLMSLDATTAPTRLRSEAFDVSVGKAVAHVRTKGDRVELSLDTTLSDAKAGGLSAQDARLRLTAAAPYPDLAHRRGDGALVARASLDGKHLVLDGQAFEEAQLSAALTGQAKGWIPDLVVTGQAVADLRAASSAVAGAKIKGLRVAATSPDVKWSRKGGDTVSATVKVSGLADVLAVSDLTLTDTTVTLEGPASVDHRGAVMRLTGHAFGHGAWSGLGAPTALDSAEIAAVKRALRGFRLDAPGFAVTADRVTGHIALSHAVQLTPDRGGLVRLAPQGAGWRLSSAGGGLPKVEADVERVALVPGGATAQGRVKAALSIGPIQQGVFDAAGTLRMGTGVTFTASRCASIQAARLEMGENDIEALAGRLCPIGEPLLSLNGADWRIAGRAEGVSARAPFLQARVADGSGRVLMGQRRGGLYATAAIASARVEDAAPSTRFNPLKLAGTAELARELWTADLAIATPAGQPVATAKLRHQGPSGRGGVDFDTGLLTFADGGLQPLQLSPLAAAAGSPATGSARFAGGFQWTPGGATSGGVLDIQKLDFVSPAGAITGLSGEVAFTSLAPLVAAPGQVLKADGLASFVPVTGLTATFALGEKALIVSGGEAAVGGGRVRVETLEIPFTPDQPTRGVLNFDGVQLGELVEASPFADRVDLDAKVSGRIPFEATGQKVRITGGDLKAIQPGRLSIQRTALTGVAVEDPGAAAAVGPPGSDTFTDFAYQAMEHLAFQTLDASINSQPDGRLGVLFHVIGKHDPPTRQVIRLSWIDVLRRRFLNRTLPLPSGTGVNLTLDTTLNLDELLADYADYRRLHSSPTVQP
ncbi:MAG: YdbH domain-containing protein [Phenylobacterium sp.]